jgi:16S rRNA processing protein RimM
VSYTARPERWAQLSRVYVGDAPYELESVWYHRDQPIFKFKGVDTIGQAETLAGQEVFIPESERGPLDEGEYYLSDLIGCRLLDDSSGREIGIVTGWQETAGPVLLEVDDGRVLVPFARSILKTVDCARREIRAALPDGLESLNG